MIKTGQSPATAPPAAEPPKYGSAADRLLDAAEQLIALHGEEGASARAILIAAGTRHKSAIDYHFGGRRGLFDAVWVRGSAAVSTRRTRVLQQLPEGQPSLADLVHAYVEPLADYIGSLETSYWARFNEEALRRYPLAIAPNLRTELAMHDEEQPLGQLLDLLEQMQRLVCSGEQPRAGLRVSTVVRTVLSTFASWEREAERTAPTVGAAELGRELETLSLAMLRA